LAHDLWVNVVNPKALHAGSDALVNLHNVCESAGMRKSRSRSAKAASSKPLSTRSLILDEAEHLIALKGVYGFTLKDIADPLSVRAPAIYKHYKSRDDVLVEVSRRFIALLSRQFQHSADAAGHPVTALRRAIDRFVEFHIEHPAYVRLSLTDFATPQGGMEYISLAAGGAFRDNLSSGPLVRSGELTGAFRRVSALDFYRLIKSTLLIRLVFPDDLLVTGARRDAVSRRVKALLWDVASRYLAATPRM
jgi:AcrR family transcriptional regulator